MILGCITLVLTLALLVTLIGCNGGTTTTPTPTITATAPMPTTSPDGWEWQNPLPQGNILFAVWGSSAGDVYAVGDGGAILHYDGHAWRNLGSLTIASLLGVWGSSAGDVYAVGNEGTILHYDGHFWREMNSGTTKYLYGVWGSSPWDVYAVGDDGTILHYGPPHELSCAPGAPAIAVIPTSGPPGISVSIIGCGFDPYAVLGEVEIDGFTVPLVPTFVTDAYGRFTLSFIVPGLPHGSYTITVKILGKSADAVFNIT